MNLFLSALTSEQRIKLENAKIVCADFSIGSVDGVIIEEDQLPAVLELLECAVRSRQSSGIHGVKRVVLKPNSRAQAAPPATSRAGSVKLDGTIETLQRIATQVVGNYLQVEVVLHQSGAQELPDYDGRFHIHLFSTPAGAQSGVRPPEHIWGVPVDCRDYAWRVSGQGYSIVDEQSGYSVAELVGERNLYIHHNLARHGTLHEEKLLRLILSKALASLERPGSSRQASKQLFVDECSKSTGLVLKNSPAVEKRVDKIRQLKKELAKRIRDARAVEEKAIRGESLSAAAFGQEYDALLRVPKVKDVKVDGRNIVVYTDVLYCKDDRSGYLHEIGAFRIELPLGGASPRWFNQTRRVTGIAEGQHAPHVYSDGHACLGNTADVFRRLLRDHQFAIAAQYAIEFVEQANTADPAGKRIDNWPRARKKK